MASHDLADSRHSNYGALERGDSSQEFDDDDDDDLRDYRTLLNEHLLATPFVGLTFAGFMQAVRYWPMLTGDRPRDYNWNMFLWGASGWSAAFVVRRPIFLAFVSVAKVNAPTSAVLTHVLVGVLEEVTRLGWIRLSHVDGFPDVYWLGIGWAAAEAFCFLVQRFIQVQWYKHGPEKDMDEREELADILGVPLNRLSAWWGVMWRGMNIMAHIGYSCWLAYSPFLLCPAAIIHSILNVAWYDYLSKWGIPGTSYATLIISMSVFLIGLALQEAIV